MTKRRIFDRDSGCFWNYLNDCWTKEEPMVYTITPTRLAAVLKVTPQGSKPLVYLFMDHGLPPEPGVENRNIPFDSLPAAVRAHITTFFDAVFKLPIAHRYDYLCKQEPWEVEVV